MPEGLALLDWRRRVAALYARVRAEPDPATAYDVWVQGRTWLQAHHGQSADRSLLLRHAAYDVAWRAELQLDPDVAPRHLDISTATDGVVPYDRLGVVRHPLLGELSVWWVGSYGGGVWLPLRDPSPLTYGGGRYLLDTAKGADLGGEVDPVSGRGTLVVDANFAYNPSCAYDEAWACPLPPEGNVTTHAVEAGELTPVRTPARR